MKIEITKKQLKFLIEQSLTREQQLENFINTEEKIKSSYIGKKKVIEWKKRLESKYPDLSFRFQIGNDVLIVNAKINR
jgi:hypothetical protein